MILDLGRFIAAEQASWNELEMLLRRMGERGRGEFTLGELDRFFYLYQRSSSDLARLSTFSAEPRTREYLQSLVAMAYAEIHTHGREGRRFRPLIWLLRIVPQTFRRNLRPFVLSVAITLAGTGFGAASLHFDPSSKQVLIPFGPLLGSPADRVRQEETVKADPLANHKATFSANLIENNIRVSFTCLALGVTWGIGPVILLFYNGVILGAVATDYIQAGFTPFLLGWLLPHGAVEIPAILVAGQAAFVLAGALIGWGDRTSRRQRLRAVSTDLMTLAGLIALMLAWAGFVEAFLSQYHAPVIPYAAKIALGIVEIVAITAFLSLAGRSRTRS